LTQGGGNDASFVEKMGRVKKTGKFSVRKIKGWLPQAVKNPRRKSSHTKTRGKKGGGKSTRLSKKKKKREGKEIR